MNHSGRPIFRNARARIRSKRGLALPGILALAEIASLFAAGCPRPAPRIPVHDIVLVTIDTLRYDALDFDGNNRGVSPNLDAMAREGRVFSRAHGENVVTLPSHVNILTGLYPFTHGVRDNSGFRLAPDVPTVASILRDHDFLTGAFVAAFPLDSRFGLARGFDVYDQTYQGAEAPTEFRIPRRRGDEVVAAALAWWAKNAEHRRFLWVHLYDPHAPYDPPSPFRERYANDPYLGEVAFTDSALGPLFSALRKTKGPKPLLVVTADHGEARGDHGELTHGLFAYEATLHVPLLLWGPGRVEASSAPDPRLARHIDIAPTILEAAGVPVPERLPGRSLLGPAPKEPSYFESLSAALNRGWAPLRGVIDGDDKYIELPVPELYDLSRDPSERHNLAAEKPRIVLRLKRELDAWPIGNLARGPVSREEAAKLRSLGYLTGGEALKKSYRRSDDPKNLIGVDRQLHQVVDLFQAGRLEGAVEISRKIVAEQPAMPLGYEQLGYLLQQTGDLTGALQLYDRARRQGIDDEAFARRRALLLAELGRPRQSLEQLLPYRQSEDQDTLNALGIALADSGRLPDALAAFERALALDSRNGQTYQNVGITELKADRTAQARENLEKALSLNPRNPRAWNALGVALMRLGSPGQALEAWSKAVAYDPKQYDALFNIGLVALREGDRSRARRALEQFVATAPPSRYGADIRQVRKILATL
jgi:arylsulfatase A-like enzyme/Flp pilus assembly protein TadD